MSILPELWPDLILGLDFQSQHGSVTFSYGGSKPPLPICSLSTLKIDTTSVFVNLIVDCHPVATKSRRYRQEDLGFIINDEVDSLLQEGIEPSQSPWLAQVVVIKDENDKKLLVIDYLQTTNRFTQLDAFSLPKIIVTTNEIVQYKVFSTLDLQSACHHITLKSEAKPCTAFKGKGGLYQCTRLPFGLTKEVACFQREMVKIKKDYNLKAVFLYLDNSTVCEINQADEDTNLKYFLMQQRKAV